MKTSTDLDDAVAEVAGIVGTMMTRVDPFGSVYTHGEGRDLDVILMDMDNPHRPLELLQEHGFVQSISESYDATEFISLRRGDVNAIVCLCEDYYYRSKCGSEIVKFLVGRGVTIDKQDRVHIHNLARGDLLP